MSYNTSGNGNGNGNDDGSLGLFAIPQPYVAVSNPNVGKSKGAATSKAAVNQVATVEVLDDAATKQNKGKKLTTTSAKTAVYTEAKKDADVVLLLTKGKSFKIVGVTKNYFIIQYKKKDGKVYKGYILQSDVKVK